MSGVIKLQFKIAWWFRSYVKALIFFCQLHGTEPDENKLKKVLSKAIVIQKG
jgi:hypothetical protein